MIDSPERMSFLKSDDVKNSPAKPPRDISQDGHEHGEDDSVEPVGSIQSVHIHIAHKHGHKHSDHKSVQEAMDHLQSQDTGEPGESKPGDDEGAVPLD
jgi:hypothetical protein